MPIEKKFFTVKEAAEFCEVSTTTWYKWQRILPIKMENRPGSSRKKIARATLEKYLDDLGKVDAKCP